MIAHPLVRFSANLPFLAILPFLRHKRLAIGEVLAQVLGDERSLRENDRLGGTRRRDGHQRGLAKRMELGQLWRGQHVLAPVVYLQFVGNLELLKQEEGALRPRAIEPFWSVVSYDCAQT